MVGELVDAFGMPYAQGAEEKTFPVPNDIAAVSFEEFSQRVKLGYRANYIHQLSQDITDGKLGLDGFTDKKISTEEIRRALLSIKGIGAYAAASMLMLLGRYDHIAVDTVFRDFMKAKYFSGKTYSEEEGLAIYDDWGEWKYLAYWFDLILFYREKP